MLLRAALAAAIAGTAIAQQNPNPVNGPVPTALPLASSPGVRPDLIWHPDGADDADDPHLPDIDITKLPPAPMPFANRPTAPRRDRPKDTVIFVDTEAGIVQELPLGDAQGLAAAKSLPPFEGIGPVGSEPGGENWSALLSAVSNADLSTYPTRANCKLIMHYITTGGNDSYYVCSGSMQDGGVVLTAAHCVYHHDDNIDDYPVEIWVIPSWDGVGNTNGGGPDSLETLNKYGWARSTSWIVGSAYVNSGDYDRDCAALRLSRSNTRSVGMLTGSFGWSYGYCDTDVTHYNFSYPAEQCSSTLHTGRQMYYWADQPDGCPGTFDNQYDLNHGGGCFGAAWGGMSGSGMYRFIDGARHVGAVASHGNRDDYSAYCGLWEQFTIDLETFKSNTRGSTFDLEALQYRVNGSTTVDQGDQIPAGTVVLSNATNANPGARDITIRVYLSQNADISASDTLIATWIYNLNFGPMHNYLATVPAMTIPYGTPTGNYFLGVIIDSAEDTNPNNNDGNTWDAQPITVTPCSLLGAPPNFSATNGTLCDRVRLTWTQNGGDTYRIYRATTNNFGSSSNIVTVGGISQWDDTSALAGTTYYYWIRAVNGCGNGTVSAANAGYRLTGPDSAPLVAASDGNSCDSTTISWSAVAEASNYFIFRNTVNSGGTATYLATDDASPYVDTTGTPGQVYYYFVRPTNACSQGPTSAGTTGYRQTTAGQPTNVQATNGAYCDRVIITWSDVPNASNYTVWRGASNIFAFATQVGNATPGNSMTDYPPQQNTTYYYWVRSSNICGPGLLSAFNTGSSTTLAVPTGVTASDGPNCTPSVLVSWNAVPTAISYRVYRNTTPSTSFATLLADDVVSLSFADATASPDTPYYYFVTAFNNCHQYSGASAFDLGNRGGAPGQVTNVQASDARTCRSVSVSWTGVAGASGYEIRRNTTNSILSSTLIGTDTASPYTDNTAAPNTTYFYWVRATSSCGNGPQSVPDQGSAGSTIVFDTQPSDLTVTEGAQARFSVDVGGATGYQWRKDGVNLTDDANITGATTDTLTILAASEADEGRYACFVTSPCGNVLSNGALLTVDGIPCPADFNQDGGIDGADVDAFFAAWEAGDPQADTNLDGGVDGADVDFFFAAWEAGGCF